MFERPILFYSDYCVHSTNFVNALMKHQDIFDAFIRVNIDIDQKTKTRPDIFYTVQNTLKYKIVEVPTIVIMGGEYILSGVEAFKWLESQIKSDEPEELTGFNPIEMGSFSDSYSSYGSKGLNDDVREQTFKFIGKPDAKINTPEETGENISSEEYNLKQRERENFGNTNPGQNKFHLDNSIKAPPMNLDRSLFTNNRNNPNISQKQKEFDNRYQQMLVDRQNM
jgi:hypothetical protein